MMKIAFYICVFFYLESPPVQTDSYKTSIANIQEFKQGTRLDTYSYFKQTWVEFYTSSDVKVVHKSKKQICVLNRLTKSSKI